METPTANTIFDPVSSCTQDIYHVLVADFTCDTVSNDFQHACRYFHLGPTSSTSDCFTSDCFPSGWSPDAGAHISPGVCPRGYTIACAQTQDPEKTATGYNCRGGSANAPPWYTTDLCTITMPGTIMYIYTTQTPGKDFEISTTMGGGELNAFGVEVRWRVSDLATSTVSSPSSLSIDSVSTSTSASTSPTNENEPLPAETNPASQGLSAGVKAGIGIGAVAIFFLLLLIALLLWRWRKQDRDKAALRAASSESHVKPLSMSYLGRRDEYNGFGPLASWHRHRERTELPNEREMAEM
ncbi:hypothetical protein F4818DRAFT_437948 [Hypoxylon cercidicola]|nr:hypothetical protein F4818DRAFT_437948 [Hypoxylon cercidicola]